MDPGTGHNADRRARQLWLVPSEGERGRHLVADVAVNAPATDLYAYAVPDGLKDVIQPGATLRVPYGRGGRAVEGLCVRVSEKPWDHTRRPVLAAEPGQPWWSQRLIELGLWVSDYYVCSPWKTFAAMLPAAARKPRLRAVTYVRATRRAPEGKLTAGQAALRAALGAGEARRTDLLRQAGVGPGTLQALRKRGLIEVVVRQEPAPPRALPSSAGAATNCPEDAFELTPAQQAALAALRDARELSAGAKLDNARPAFRVFLLFGVPGSGKTEVYVRAMRDVVAAGRQAILLIPEIALATQVVERLARRFDRVAVLHSQLAAGLRRDTLAAIAGGAVDVVIGTRSAVFAPCPRLGLIVVDEEQETSLKNLAAPHYHARDVAIKRGQIEQVPVVLGSATPAIETWYNAHQRPHYRLVRLPERVPGARLPDVRLAPASPAELGETAGVLSPVLRVALEQTLAAGQQAILLHNRRGYAVHLRCAACGLLVNCQRCATHLVYHRSEQVMKCHRCGVRTPVPPRCLDDTCRGRLERTGLAIQRLEENLRQELPAARLLRLDSDTMRRREDYEAALRRFEAGEADVMLGTQMVAKGLDFPRVRLVGVIDADAALSLPDFRAGERVFQLIVQVVGRAGRRAGPSLALVQTAERPPAAIRHALRMEYEPFAAEELEARRRLFYPPFARLARLICADARPRRAREETERLATALRERAGRINARLRVDEPGACVVPRLRDMRRFEVLVRGPQGNSVQELLHAAARAKALSPRVQRFTIDVDPVDLL
jgi:primosomal protein N' (replication factor Y)